MACPAQPNQVRIRSYGLLIKGKYSLAKIFVMNSHFVISACLNGDYYFSFYFFFLGGGRGGGGRGERIHSTVDCMLSFLGIGIRFYFHLVLLYISN